jgi:predicted metal-dependent HD superfamily phosphohydrolase
MNAERWLRLMAATFLGKNSAREEEVARVHRLIIATEHNALPQSRDEAALVDIDLSILGADPDTYEIFEQNVRKEYRLVPSFIYKKNGRRFFEDFWSVRESIARTTSRRLWSARPK